LINRQLLSLTSRCYASIRFQRWFRRQLLCFVWKWMQDVENLKLGHIFSGSMHT